MVGTEHLECVSGLSRVFSYVCVKCHAVSGESGISPPRGGGEEGGTPIQN